MSVSPGFGDSNGDPSGIICDNPTIYTSPVPIIKPSSGPSETPTRDPSHVSNELSRSKTSNMLMEYPSGYPTYSINTMSTESTSSNTRAQPSSDPDFLKRGSKEAQLSLQIYQMLFILLIISSSYTSQRSTQTRWRGSLRTPLIGLHETRTLLSSTSLRIFDKEKHEQVKEILFNKSAMDLNTFLFDSVNPKIGHKLRVRT